MIRSKVSAFTFVAVLSLAAPGRADTRAVGSVLDEARREAHAIRIELVQMSPDAAVQMNRRLDELERLIQRLTDKIDSLQAQQRDLARDLDRYKNDTDYRLSQIEKGNRAAPPRPPERRTEAPPPRAPERRVE